MNINHMRYFLAVAKHGNFRRAAEELNISQPALSNSIKTLEESLGAQLLERGNKAVKPTAYGSVTEKFFASALRSVERAKQELELMKGGSRGHLSIGAPTGLMSDLVPGIIAEVRKQHPNYTFSVEFSNLKQLLIRMRDGQIDVLISGYWNEANLADDLTIEGFAESSMSIYCRPQHPLAEKELVTLEDLSQQDWILPKTPLTQAMLKSIFGGEGFHSVVNQPITSEFIPFIHEMMYAADLIGLIPDHFVQQGVEDGKLVKVNYKPFPRKMNIGLMYFADRVRTPAMFAFLKIAREMGRMRRTTDEVDA